MLNFFEIYSVIPKNFLFKKLFFEIGPLTNFEILYFFIISNANLKDYSINIFDLFDILSNA